jgi:hypothetical protein
MQNLIIDNKKNSYVDEEINNSFSLSNKTMSLKKPYG